MGLSQSPCILLSLSGLSYSYNVNCLKDTCMPDQSTDNDQGKGSNPNATGKSAPSPSTEKDAHYGENSDGALNDNNDYKSRFPVTTINHSS